MQVQLSKGTHAIDQISEIITFKRPYGHAKWYRINDFLKQLSKMLKSHVHVHVCLNISL